MLTLKDVTIVDDTTAILHFEDNQHQSGAKLYEMEDGKWPGMPPSLLKENGIGKQFNGRIIRFVEVGMVIFPHEEESY